MSRLVNQQILELEVSSFAGGIFVGGSLPHNMSCFAAILLSDLEYD